MQQYRRVLNLHSIMYLLIRYNEEGISFRRGKFTFHNVSINSVTAGYVQITREVIYIP